MNIYNPDRTLHVTQGHGKMEGIPSINTNSLSNPYCQKASTDRFTVCNKCYGNRLLKFRKGLHDKCDHNSIIFESRPQEIWIPPLNSQIFRFHSFGELLHLRHLIHYHEICLMHRETTFSLWTKRIPMVWRYQEEFAVPANLVLVYSEPRLNPIVPQIPIGFDHCYAVYEKTSPVTIDCPEKCIECQRCYQKKTKEIIRARLK